MPTKTEHVLFEIFSEFMIVLDLYERLDDDDLVKFMENVSAKFITLDRDVLDRYKAYLKTAIEHENERGAFERASSLEDLTDLVD
jgi:hypothetical protein